MSRGSRSRSFRRVVRLRSEPRRFIDSLAHLLGPKGEGLKRWAGDLSPDELGREIERILEKGVLDEWQFLFNATQAGSGSVGESGGGSSAGTSREYTETGSTEDEEDYRSGGDEAGGIIGEEIQQTIEEIAELISSSLLSNVRRLVVVHGKSRTGKSTIIEEICNKVRNKTGILGCDLKEIASKTIFDQQQFCFMDDADVEIATPTHEVEVERYYKSKKNHSVILLTCKSLRRMSGLVESCEGKVFRVPELSPSELAEVISITEVGSYRLCDDTARRVVNLITALRVQNPVATGMDVAISLIYPLLLSAYSKSQVSRGKVVSCTDPDIRKAVTKVTGIPVEPGGRGTVSRLSRKLSARVLGQDHIIEAITPMMAAISSGMTDPTKPAGSIFSFGPTGTGKTLLGEVIAEEMFNGKFHKEDMNTYSEKHSVARLTGAPPGYIGYNDTPAILTFIDENPRGVIVLDEIEKAHETVCDHVMEMLDTGFIRDTKGALHDARGFLVIMTSNVGHGGKVAEIGFTKKGSGSLTARDELVRTGAFKKEFIGRIQVVCKYKPLEESILTDIAGLIFDDLKSRLGSIGVRIRKSKTLIERIVGSYDETVGARSMKTFAETVIKSEILNKCKEG